MVKNIKIIGDNVLRGKCRKVNNFGSERLNLLLRDMAETMYEENGIGLAAPQIGIRRRAIVIDIGEGLYEIINPEIVSLSDETIGMVEGCLSVPGRRGYVIRPEKLTLKAQDRLGEELIIEAEGLFARCIQHEMDHLDGVLYVDKMEYEVFEDEEDE